MANNSPKSRATHAGMLVLICLLDAGCSELGGLPGPGALTGQAPGAPGTPPAGAPGRPVATNPLARQVTASLVPDRGQAQGARQPGQTRLLSRTSSAPARFRARSRDSQGRLIDDLGRFIDDQGRLIDSQGRLIDDQGRLTEDQGSLIDDQGRLIDDLLEDNQGLIELQESPETPADRGDPETGQETPSRQTPYMDTDWTRDRG